MFDVSGASVRHILAWVGACWYNVLGSAYTIAGFVIGVFCETEKHAVMGLLQVVRKKV